MNVQAALKGQYHASLKALRNTIEECPSELWSGGDEETPFWQVVFHTLFFTHLYLQPGVKDFVPWKKHRGKPERLGTRADKPYTKAQMLEYWRFCDRRVNRDVDRLDLDARTCGFPWYNLPKLDHQINNIRHIQHHTAILAARLRRLRRISIGWVGSAK